MWLGEASSPAEIFDKAVPAPGEVIVFGRNARHYMDAGIFKGDRVIEGLLENLPENILFGGQSRETSFPGLPIAGGGIEQNLCKSCLLATPCDLGLVESVGKQEFDAFETRFGGGREALQEGDFLVHHAQICGQSRHLNPVK